MSCGGWRDVDIVLFRFFFAKKWFYDVVDGQRLINIVTNTFLSMIPNDHILSTLIFLMIQIYPSM